MGKTQEIWRYLHISRREYFNRLKTVKTSLLLLYQQKASNVYLCLKSAVLFDAFISGVGILSILVLPECEFGVYLI